MKRLSSLFVLLSLAGLSYGQNNVKVQFFDGGDSTINSLRVWIDTATGNMWQVGAPQKQIFDSANTLPNVIVTDTVNTYPVGNVSRFGVTGTRNIQWPGIFAFRWTQKLDLDFKEDIGMIEFSLDSGTTWLNAFTDPLAYNFYGFNGTNVDTVNGVVGFTGTDSTWKDIWLCFQNSMVASDSIMLRFVLISDSVDNHREGWMIDNMRTHYTMVHTVAQTEKSSYLKVFPTNTTGIVFIDAVQPEQLQHRVQRVELIDAMGRVVERYKTNQQKYSIDISNHPTGTYHLRVFTNKHSKTFTILLKSR